MIEYKTGDIINEDVDALVNTVNCVGVMGRGIALEFKKAFPRNFKEYAIQCKMNEIKPGKVFVYKTGQLTPPFYIINFPTKRHWRGKSRLEDIEAGLSALKKEIESLPIQSIAIPPLGCGLGGLNWEDVRTRLQSTLEEFDKIKIVLYEPGGKSEDNRTNRSKEVPSMTLGRAVLVSLMNRYLNAMLDPYVTLIEIHKLMYFMQNAGEKLNLRFKKHKYGPYAENLRHVMNTIEGHFVYGFASGGDEPYKELKLVPGAFDDAAAFIKDKFDTLDRFKRVSELVDGFESSFGLELLTTVHWVACEEENLTLDDIVERTYAWNERKQQFTPRQIVRAFDVLKEKGWVSCTTTLNREHHQTKANTAS